MLKKNRSTDGGSTEEDEDDSEEYDEDEDSVGEDDETTGVMWNPTMDGSTMTSVGNIRDWFDHTTNYPLST